MPLLLRKRILAILTDLGYIALYILVLYIIFSIIKTISGQNTVTWHPVTGQAVGFFLLTLPVFFYYYIYEKKFGYTPGKKWNRVYLVFNNRARAKAVFQRNFLKLLPWELAHTGGHWLIYYLRQGYSQPPFWVIVLLILPQLIVIIYIISLFLSKGKTTYYDKISETEVAEFPAMEVN